jgi:hypothetical protein
MTGALSAKSLELNSVNALGSVNAPDPVNAQGVRNETSFAILKPSSDGLLSAAWNHLADAAPSGHSCRMARAEAHVPSKAAFPAKTASRPRSWPSSTCEYHSSAVFSLACFHLYSL